MKALAKIIGWTGVGFIALYVLFALNYAPLWTRAYGWCVEQNPPADSVAAAIATRKMCAEIATTLVDEADRRARGLPRR